MNSMIRLRLLATALVAVAIVGCNAVEDVRDAPFTPIPPEGVVLQGKVTGTLGSRRAITLINNGNSSSGTSVSYVVGTPFSPFTFGVVPVGSPYNVTIKTTPFGKICSVSGGSGTVTTAAALNIVVNCVNDPAVPRYNVKVVVPSTFGDRAGAKVTLTTEEGVFDQIPASGATSVTFSNAVFNNVVGGVVWGSANNTTSTANGGINPYTNIVGGTVNGVTFGWALTATTTEGSTPERPQLNRCNMTSSTNFTGSASGTPGTPNFTNVAMPPVANIGFGTQQVPTVTTCQFTIGGTVFYSTPPAASTAPNPAPVPQTMPVGGLDIQLRDVQGNVIETLTYTGGYGTSGTSATSIAGNPYTFVTPGRSSANSVYDVAVSRHPAGQYCVAANGGQATLGVVPPTNPANITNANIVCRALPAGSATSGKLRGTYGFYSGVTYNYPSPTSTTATITTSTLVTGADGTLTTTTVQTIVTNTRTTYNALTNAGLSGESRGQSLSQENVVRTFVTVKAPGGAPTITSDVTVPGTAPLTSTNTNTTRNFLTFFEDGTFLHGAHGTSGNQIEHGFYYYNPTTRVISFSFVTDTAVTTAPATQGTAAPVTGALSGTPGATASSATALAATLMTNVTKSALGPRGQISGDFAFVGTVLTRPVSMGTLVPGSRWASWVMVEPKNTDGLLEGPFVPQDHRRAWNYDNNTTLGFHVGVSGAAPNLQDGCFTFEDFRATSGFYTRRGGLTGCLDAVSFPVGIGTIDIPSTTVGTPVTLNNLPGFVGRMPGSETAFDGRSPSPIFYAIGPANTVGTIADPTYFPPAEVTPAAFSWCLNATGTGPGEVYMVRSSLNGIAINKPLYLCRERTN